MTFSPICSPNIYCAHHEPISFQALGTILEDSEADQTPVLREFMFWEQMASISEPQVCWEARGKGGKREKGSCGLRGGQGGREGHCGGLDLDR